VSLSYVDTDGENISLEGDEDDGYNNKTAQINLGYDFTDDINLNGFYRHTAAVTDFDETFFGAPVDADKHTEGVQEYGSLVFQIASFERRWINDVGVQINRSDEDSFTDRMQDNNVETSKERGYWQSSWLPGGDDNNSLTFVLERVRENFQQQGYSLSDHSQSRLKTRGIDQLGGGHYVENPARLLPV
jgi:vitamin B12 transporter